MAIGGGLALELRVRGGGFGELLLGLGHSFSASAALPTALPVIVISSCHEEPQSTWPGGWATTGAIFESVS